MSDAREPILIVPAGTQSAQIAQEHLGAAGVPSELHIVPVFHSKPESGGQPVFDGTKKRFTVEVTLSRTAPNPEIYLADFTEETGSSFIKFASTARAIKIDASLGTSEVRINRAGQLSLITSSVEAINPTEARFLAQNMWSQFLDHLSYVGNVPMYEGLVRIKDSETQTQTIAVVGPNREFTVSEGLSGLNTDMAPVYALYREYKCSQSAFYRTLCLYKIMEGIYGHLKQKARSKAKRLAFKYDQEKELVPEHTDIAPWLREYVGRSIAQFYSGPLQKRYRDSVAHFLLTGSRALKVSSAEQREEFAHVAFVAELCIRRLIANHEAFLDALSEAEANAT